MARFGLQFFFRHDDTMQSPYHFTSYIYPDIALPVTKGHVSYRYFDLYQDGNQATRSIPDPETKRKNNCLYFTFSNVGSFSMGEYALDEVDRCSETLSAAMNRVGKCRGETISGLICYTSRKGDVVSSFLGGPKISSLNRKIFGAPRTRVVPIVPQQVE